jgi:hypothetical protein
VFFFFFKELQAKSKEHGFSSENHSSYQHGDEGAKATSYSYPLAPLKGERARVRGQATKATNTFNG